MRVSSCQDHHRLLHSSPLLKNTCVRQAVLDKWSPWDFAELAQRVEDGNHAGGSQIGVPRRLARRGAMEYVTAIIYVDSSAFLYALTCICVSSLFHVIGGRASYLKRCDRDCRGHGWGGRSETGVFAPRGECRRLLKPLPSINVVYRCRQIRYDPLKLWPPLSFPEVRRLARRGGLEYQCVFGPQPTRNQNPSGGKGKRELEYRIPRLHSPINSWRIPEIFGDFWKNKTIFL